MIKLSKRLAAAAELVRPCESFADIGCDHGYLPAYLVQNNIVKKAYACDINEGPLSKCREVAEQEGVAGKITCILAPGLRLADGLDGAADLAPEDIFILGMGGELIADIIAKCPFAKSKDVHFVLNPMTRQHVLRRRLCESGFEIGRDIIVAEGRHYYNVFEASYTGKIVRHDESYYFLGNIKDFSNREYFEHLLNFLENKQKGYADYSEVISAIKEKL